MRNTFSVSVAMGNTAIQEVFSAVHNKLANFSPTELADVDFASKNIPFVGEIYMGHLRYSTTGKRGLSYAILSYAVTIGGQKISVFVLISI